jgi:UDPglucose 6-dehydrogenase
VKKHFDNDLKGRVFGLWGLAFKPNTDDMREAPAITIVNELTKAGATVRAFDPVAADNARKVIGDKITYCSSAYEVTENADALILVTEWNEFRHPDFEEIKKELKTPVIFDGRNVYNPEQLRKLGFTYYGIGRS